jgi:membrane dipeptidase
MRFMDGHCDVLWKIWKDPEKYLFDAEDSPSMDVTYQRLKDGNVGLETFAIFVPSEVPKAQKLDVALKQIDYFYEKVLSKPGMQLVRSAEDLQNSSTDTCLALLSLEGADALNGELAYLRLFYHLGVRQVGLTWNQANEVADGIGEERGGGLTQFGFQFVQEMERLRMILDVSHLSVRGFWDVVEHHSLPIIASHSNCMSICSHKRNLNNDQILALISKKGLMGITFVPSFLHRMENKARIGDIILHIEHVCELGGEDILYFGSDFDGFTVKVPGLEHIGQVNNLLRELEKHYPSRLIQKWCWENAYLFYKEHLATKKR